MGLLLAWRPVHSHLRNACKLRFLCVPSCFSLFPLQMSRQALRLLVLTAHGHPVPNRTAAAVAAVVITVVAVLPVVYLPHLLRLAHFLRRLKCTRAKCLLEDCLLILTKVKMFLAYFTVKLHCHLIFNIICTRGSEMISVSIDLHIIYVI